MHVEDGCRGSLVQKNDTEYDAEYSCAGPRLVNRSCPRFEDVEEKMVPATFCGVVMVAGSVHKTATQRIHTQYCANVVLESLIRAPDIIANSEQRSDDDLAGIQQGKEEEYQGEDNMLSVPFGPVPMRNTPELIVGGQAEDMG